MHRVKERKGMERLVGETAVVWSAKATIIDNAESRNEIMLLTSNTSNFLHSKLDHLITLSS